MPRLSSGSTTNVHTNVGANKLVVDLAVSPASNMLRHSLELEFSASDKKIKAITDIQLCDGGLIKTEILSKLEPEKLKAIEIAYQNYIASANPERELGIVNGTIFAAVQSKIGVKCASR